ncbi:MAG: aminodeoxychorismate/anthranilate synthase component II [Chlamydiia bacterium]|nr:aminodeoxychorismate/anthranilate synthase component II [Chlamydiia bacterium]
MLLLLDNRDSFTYNLVHALRLLDKEVRVVREEQLGPNGELPCDADSIVIGPGPGCPAQLHKTKEMVRRQMGRLPILGVCLGHQLIAEMLGARIVRAPMPVHGKTQVIEHTGRGLFQGLERELVAVRYHSLVVERASLPSCLEVAAWVPEGELMAFHHRTLPLYGLQFHPESIGTKHGAHLLSHFLFPRKGI